jgi:hypothetical protein
MADEDAVELRPFRKPVQPVNKSCPERLARTGERWLDDLQGGLEHLDRLARPGAKAAQSLPSR